MNIRAVYLPDLAFANDKKNYTFEYNYESNKFEMIIDNECAYEIEMIIEDANFMLFVSEIICDGFYPYDEEHTIKSGNICIIKDKGELYNIIKLIKNDNEKEIRKYLKTISYDLD